MAVLKPARSEKLHRRGLLLEWFTVAWNVIEGVVAIGVGIVTGSVSLVAFGADSFIEVISAVALEIAQGRPARERRGTGGCRAEGDVPCWRRLSSCWPSTSPTRP
jgi:hypothetical protein